MVRCIVFGRHAVRFFSFGSFVCNGKVGKFFKSGLSSGEDSPELFKSVINFYGCVVRYVYTRFINCWIRFWGNGNGEISV